MGRAGLAAGCAKHTAYRRTVVREVDLFLAVVAPGAPRHNIELDAVVGLLPVVLGGVISQSVRTTQHVAVRVHAQPQVRLICCNPEKTFIEYLDR